jgi:adenylate kinase
MGATFDLFSPLGSPAKAKLVLLGSSDSRFEGLMDQARSFHIEHVSPAGILRQEISRRSGKTGTTEAATTAAMRKWFFARKPDAGFVLADYPATLLQAQVMDEWLDARDETLDAVIIGQGASALLIHYYTTLGVPLMEAGLAA